MSSHDAHNMNFKLSVAGLFICKSNPGPWSHNLVLLQTFNIQIPSKFEPINNIEENS
jgi:hypothetical protein